MIKTPIRYDANSRHFFDVEGNSIAWFPRNSHHERFEEMTEDAEDFVTAINDHARLVTENAALKAELEAYRGMLRLAQVEADRLINGIEWRFSKSRTDEWVAINLMTGKYFEPDNQRFWADYFELFQAIQEKTK